MAIISKCRYIKKIFCGILLTGTAIAFLQSNYVAYVNLAFNYWNPVAIADFRLKNLTTEDFIRVIEQELAENNIAEAQSLVELAKEYEIQLPEELIKRTEESYFGQSYRYSKDFATGFLVGDLSSIPSALGSVTSDLIVYGDIRDVVTEGTKLIRGEDYDSITLGLAAIGITSSTIALGSWITAGSGITAPIAVAATELDEGASLIKNANKGHNLSKPMLNTLRKASSDVIDVQNLKKALSGSESILKMPSIGSLRKVVSEVDYTKFVRGDLSDINKIMKQANPVDLVALKERFGGIVDTKTTGELQNLAGETGSLVKTGGFFTAMRLTLCRQCQRSWENKQIGQTVW
ncbi:hypothetical protein [uncultured Bartonella sp.]|uniref:hypothetical protein n=1 Tax=uncultured Bartonella sp. TaxID=104108 RepID=UPI0026193917|nr:hypothetical protein [uncultured Bartonella sp.]